jgi:hypothetical protein
MGYGYKSFDRHERQQQKRNLIIFGGKKNQIKLKSIFHPNKEFHNLGR